MNRPHFQIEEALYKEGYRSVVGIDEAGRGSWAGPLVSAGVVLPKNFAELNIPVRDSKLLTENARVTLYNCIIEAVDAYHIEVIEHDSIDTHGISYANVTAPLRVIDKLQPDFALVDYINTPFASPVPMQLIRNGDKRIASIAAASIVAKVFRDRLMQELSNAYPHYGFEKNKGYGTKEHLAQIHIHGICPVHRRSYNPIKNFL